MPEHRRAGGKGRARGIRQPKNKRDEKLSVRVTPDLKKRIVAAAKKKGHTESREAELRLARSMEIDAKFERALGSATGRGFAVLAAKATAHVEGWCPPGESWRSNEEAHRAFRSAIDTLLVLLAPASESGKLTYWNVPRPALQRPGSPKTPEDVGEMIAASLWHQLTGPDADRFPSEQPETGVQLLDSFYLFPQIRVDLELDKQEKPK